MRIYRVWCSDNGDEEDARRVEAYDMQGAAELYVEVQHSNFDYAMNVGNVCVRDESGMLTTWNVEVEAVPQAHAAQVKP